MIHYFLQIEGSKDFRSSKTQDGQLDMVEQFCNRRIITKQLVKLRFYNLSTAIFFRAVDEI